MEMYPLSPLAYDVWQNSDKRLSSEQIKAIGAEIDLSIGQIRNGVSGENIADALMDYTRNKFGTGYREIICLHQQPHMFEAWDYAKKALNQHKYNIDRIKNIHEGKNNPSNNNKPTSKAELGFIGFCGELAVQATIHSTLESTGVQTNQITASPLHHDIRLLGINSQRPRNMPYDFQITIVPNNSFPIPLKIEVKTTTTSNYPSDIPTARGNLAVIVLTDFDPQTFVENLIDNRNDFIEEMTGTAIHQAIWTYVKPYLDSCQTGEYLNLFGSTYLHPQPMQFI